MNTPHPAFWQRLIRWQRVHGRHDLPWQHTRDPYRVWLSEVMLQQTQVVTVVRYYTRFLQAFPDAPALADAGQDAVLALWSGLGYYSRARNLHRCAQVIRDKHQGAFPRTAAELAQLPGIGPSTAAAIAAFCFDERVSILDANVQRVLARVLGFAGDLSYSAQSRVLAQHAHAFLPPATAAGVRAMPAYTQALMDLGATACTARQPRCTACPLQDICVAHQQGAPLAYPVKTRRLQRSAENVWMLVLRTPQGVWLQKRPQTGIWAGLYCVPLFDSEAALGQWLLPLGETGAAQHAPAFKHVLTHKDLYLHPVLLDMPQPLREPPPYPEGGWVRDWQALGLPAPVRAWLMRNSLQGYACSRK